MKERIAPGKWKVEVVTDEGLVLGIIPFEVVDDSSASLKRLTKIEL